MQRVDLSHIRVRPASRLEGWLRHVPALFLVLLVLGWLPVWMGLWFPSWRCAEAFWPLGTLAALSSVALAAGLTRQLPPQNVFLACTLLMLAGAGLYALNLATGIPFGIRVPNEAIGRQFYWAMPMAWVTALLASRGVARLVLRPIRTNQAYGYWVLGVSLLLSILFELSFQPFATGSGALWSWQPAKIPGDWYGTPWLNFFGWAVSALLMLAFVTPTLINKNPIRRAPDHFPLWVWLLLKTLFVTAAALQHFQGAALLGGAEIALVSCLVFYGSRPRNKEPIQAG